MTGARIGRVLVHVVMAGGAVVMMFPFVWMLLAAFKTPQEIASVPPQILPGSLRFDNFSYALQTGSFDKYFVNTTIVTVAVVATTVFTSILAGYAFSAFKFPGRRAMLSMAIALMMVPFEVVVIINFETIVRWRLMDTLFAQIIPFTTSIFSMLIMRNAFQALPSTLWTAARVDGASHWVFLWRVAVPVSRPAIATVAVLTAIGSWNAFLWPLLVTTTTQKRTLTVGLYSFITEGGVRYERLMAGTALVILPMVVVFLCLRRYIIRGISTTGLKT